MSSAFHPLDSSQMLRISVEIYISSQKLRLCETIGQKHSLPFLIAGWQRYEMIRGRRHYLTEPKVKLMMYQLIKALDHMHRNGRATRLLAFAFDKYWEICQIVF